MPAMPQGVVTVFGLSYQGEDRQEGKLGYIQLKFDSASYANINVALQISDGEGETFEDLLPVNETLMNVTDAEAWNIGNGMYQLFSIGYYEDSVFVFVNGDMVFNSTYKDDISGGLYSQLITKVPNEVQMHTATWIEGNKVKEDDGGRRRRMEPAGEPDPVEFFDPTYNYDAAFDEFRKYDAEGVEEYNSNFDDGTLDDFYTFTLVAPPNYASDSVDSLF